MNNPDLKKGIINLIVLLIAVVLHILITEYQMNGSNAMATNITKIILKLLFVSIGAFLLSKVLIFFNNITFKLNDLKEYSFIASFYIMFIIRLIIK
jgi:hypothetical protein